MIPVSPTIISRLRRRPDFKKIKILDKRWWNVKRHRISHYTTWNQCKVLCISNMLFVKTMWNRCFGWSLCTFHHSLSRIFWFFKSGLLLSRDMMVGDTGIMRTLRTTNAHVKRQGWTQKFLSNEHSFQHVFMWATMSSWSEHLKIFIKKLEHFSKGKK